MTFVSFVFFGVFKIFQTTRFQKTIVYDTQVIKREVHYFFIWMNILDLLIRYLYFVRLLELSVIKQ